MTKGQELRLRLSNLYVCLVLFGIGAGIIYACYASVPTGTAMSSMNIAGMVIGTAFATVGIGSIFWYDCKTIVQFACDGTSLKFRRLGNTEPETKAISEIRHVETWIGRSDAIGYEIVFRDGSRVYLRDFMTNATLLATELGRNLRATPATEED